MLSIRDETAIIYTRCKQFCKVHIVTTALEHIECFIILQYLVYIIIAVHYIIRNLTVKCRTLNDYV